MTDLDALLAQARLYEEIDEADPKLIIRLAAAVRDLRERRNTALSAVMEISESLVSEASVASRAGQERRLMALSNRLVTIIRQAVLDEATRETT